MTSPLEQIRKRMAETRERDTIDILVPGPNYDGSVYIRYARKVSLDDAVAIFRKGDKGSHVLAQLEFLVDSCVGVWVEGGFGFNDASSTDPDEWPVFDASLAEMLPDGVESRAVVIARAFFAAAFPAAPNPEDDDRLIRSEKSITEHAKQLQSFYGYGAEGN